MVFSVKYICSLQYIYNNSIFVCSILPKSISIDNWKLWFILLKSINTESIFSIWIKKESVKGFIGWREYKFCKFYRRCRTFRSAVSGTIPNIINLFSNWDTSRSVSSVYSIRIRVPAEYPILFYSNIKVKLHTLRALPAKITNPTLIINRFTYWSPHVRA